MNNRERYIKGAHTVLELQYHFAWKTKYSYKVLNGDIALRLRDLVKEVCSLQGMSVIRGNIRPDHDSWSSYRRNSKKIYRRPK